MRQHWRWTRETGLGLLEVVVVLSVLAALASVVAPIAARQVERDLAVETRQQLFEIYRGLLGDPDMGTYGFVGDIGDLPNALADLITKPSALPVFTTATTVGKIGAGWRGPYVDRGFFSGDEFRDAWGQTFEYGGKTGTGGGRTGRGQTRSAGADGQLGTADDLVFPLSPIVTDGTVLATVYVIESGKESTQQFVPNPTTTEILMYKTVDGVQTTQATLDTPTLNQPDDLRRGFGFTVHHGPHAMRVRHYKDANKVPSETVEKVVVVMARAQRQVISEPYLVHVGAGIKSK